MEKQTSKEKEEIIRAMRWMVKRERDRDLGVLVYRGIKIGEEIEVQECQLQIPNQ